MKKKTLSFIIPFFLLLILLTFQNIFSGKESFLYSDAVMQYYRLLCYFKDALCNIGSLFYSFNKGLGGSMISTIAYYLSSPLNLLLFLFKNVYVFYIFITLIKISLCGTTMYFFLNYHFKNNKYLLIFSTAYALSLYNIAGYFQIMWLDSVMLAPLVLLGIDKIIHEKRPLLYGISLFLAILSNYYIGYMICIFSCLYLIYRLVLNKFDKKSLYIFLITSLLSGLMTMFLNIPNIIKIIEGKRQTIEYFGLFNSNVLDIISKMFIGTVNHENFTNPNSAFLYCGIFIIPLIFLYFLNKNINKKEKVLSGLFALIFIISLLFGPINNAWHFFSPPNCFNARYTFLFIIFFIYLACKSLDNIKYISKLHYYIITLIFLILSIFVSLSELSLIYLYISLFLYLFYILIFYNFNNKDFKVLFVILSIAELYFNMYIIFLNFNFYDNLFLSKKIEEKQEILDFLVGYDNQFYRIDFEDNEFINDSYILKYNDSSVWISTLGTSNDFFKKVGYNNATNMYSFKNNPVTNAIFNIKYFESINQYNIYENIYNHKISIIPNLYGVSFADSYLYYNKYALSIGFAINDEIDLNDKIFDNQNLLIKNMTNIDNDIYTEQKLKRINNSYILNVRNNDDYYFDIRVNNPSKCDYSIIINNKTYNQDVISDTFYLKNNFKIGDDISISVTSSCTDFKLKDLYVYSFNLNNFERYIDYLKQSELNIEEIKDGYLKGNINVTNGKRIFMSIPYECGWTVYVDGIKTNYYSLYDTFIGFDMDKGYHEIEMIYNTPGLKIGIIISSLSLAGFIMYMVFIYKKKTIID